MTTCKRNRKEHLVKCNCTYQCNLGEAYNNINVPCQNKGKCCDCIEYHRKRKELPACYFTDEQEKTYDRTIVNWWHLNGDCKCGGNYNA